MMARKHRRPNYSVYADEDSSRDVKIFISSLVIGICIGAFALYFFVQRPHSREIALLRAEIASFSSRQPVCPPARDTHSGQREELESRLSNCNASLQRLRRATEVAAQQGVESGTPPLPKPPPGRTGAEPLVPANVMPPEPPESVEIAQPVEPTPPVAATQPATAWPDDWPPKPRPHPPRPTGTAPTVETIGASTGGTVSAPTAALTGAQTVTLKVGEERDVSGYRIRLIAVSRRNTGRFCVVGGNGMVSQRIASGTNTRVNWSGHNVTLQATVRDGNTCQIALKPG